MITDLMLERSLSRMRPFPLPRGENPFVAVGLDPEAGTLGPGGMRSGDKEMSLYSIRWDGTALSPASNPLSWNRCNDDFWGHVDRAGAGIIAIDGPCAVHPNGPRWLAGRSAWEAGGAGGAGVRVAEREFSAAGIHLFWTTWNTVLDFAGGSRWIAHSLTLFAESRLRPRPAETKDRRTPSFLTGHTRGNVGLRNVTLRRQPLRLQRVIMVVGWGVLVVAGCGQRHHVDPRLLRRGDQVEVSVVGVHDGDTLTGLTVDRQQVKVRLEGIDAPELGQPFGKAAKRALSEKAFGHSGKITVVSHDQYGRVVGHVTVSGHDVGKDLVREGFAWCDPRFNHDKTLAAVEQGARHSKAGLWAEKSPTPPWEYRKHRERKSKPSDPAASARGWSWFRWWRRAGE